VTLADKQGWATYIHYTLYMYLVHVYLYIYILTRYFYTGWRFGDASRQARLGARARCRRRGPSDGAHFAGDLLQGTQI